MEFLAIKKIYKKINLSHYLLKIVRLLNHKDIHLLSYLLSTATS